jgi:hypothetical protein
MNFIWDEAKNRKNIQKHGLDFRDAPGVFDGNIITLEDDRFEYEEPRFNTLGIFQEFVVVITHTELKEPTRIISMRKGSGPERSFYEKEVLLRY